jgi:hypothetical protein
LDRRLGGPQSQSGRNENFSKDVFTEKDDSKSRNSLWNTFQYKMKELDPYRKEEPKILSHGEMLTSLAFMASAIYDYHCPIIKR